MENKSLDLWTSYKELKQLVEACITKPIDNIAGTLAKTLLKNKHNFLHIMKNAPKNARSRKIIESKVCGNGATMPQEIIDEAILLSNMYNLDEQVALDLLCTAQQRSSEYPGIPRGPIAILMYYDSHFSLATTLKMLVHGHQGLRWDTNCSPDVQKCVSKFVDDLVSDGIFESIFDALANMNLPKEINLILQNRGIGGAYHQHVVTELYTSIKETLADVVLLYSAQCGLSAQPLVSLINHLKNTKPELDANGALDNVTITLLMALVYCIDVSIVGEKDDIENIHTFIPLLCEDSLINRINSELCGATSRWQCQDLKVFVQFAWGLTLANVRSFASTIRSIDNLPDDDDSLINLCIQDNIFSFLNHAILTNDYVFKQELFLRKFHNLITEFIVLMPVHVRELKAQSEEESMRVQAHMNQGLQPPSDLQKHFEQFLQTISLLYSKDPLELRLHQEFWCLQDSSANYKVRIPPKQICLLKFIKQAGEKIPPQLFIPYINMLIALTDSSEVARVVFNMLKTYDPHFCWDHFFKSLEWHLKHIKQDQHPSSDTVYHRHHSRGISPLEVQGLQAVLHLIRTVAAHDELSRQKFYEHTPWNAIQVIMGLLNCSVHIQLKAELVLTLAAFAKSASISSFLWPQIEAAQLIPTISSTSNFQPRGLLSELEEVESRNEEYPLTKAMLELLNELLNNPVPFTLGSGTRVPGLDPYVQYVLNDVFLQLNSRAYRNIADKWDLGRSCLKLLVKIVSDYEPRHEDFSSVLNNTQEVVTKPNPHPGYVIMMNMCSQSQLLRMVFHIVDEGCVLLESYTQFAGKPVLEKATLECLKLISIVLDLQKNFLTFISNNESSAILNGLHKLLFGLNPRTNQQDYAVNIAKYVTFSSWLPTHVHYAVRILRSVTSYTTAQTELLSSIIVSNSLKQQILHGFVKCLDMDGDECEDEESEVLCEVSKTKVVILKMILQCMNYHAPNFSQFLCGFNISNVVKTTLQHAGVLGAPRTCLHSIISILGVSLKARSEPTLTPHPPAVVRLAYQVLNALAAHAVTSPSTLRYLRSSNDVLLLHLSGLPFDSGNKTEDLYQMAWLLKTIAIELRVTSHHAQLSQLTKILDILTSNNLHLDHGLRYAMLGPALNPPSGLRLIMKLLQISDLSYTPIEKPTWENFEADSVHAILRESLYQSEPNLKKINIKRVRQILTQEIAGVTEWSSLAYKRSVMNEIDSIINFALRFNDHQQANHAMFSYFDAWKQMTGVLFEVTPQDMIPFQTRFDILVQIVHHLLEKVLIDAVRPELATLCSESLLMMLSNLRSSFVSEKNAKEKSQLSQLISPHDVPLRQIVNLIITWILNAGSASQKLRSNLYSSLLTFLHLSREDGLRLRQLSFADDPSQINEYAFNPELANLVSFECVKVDSPFNVLISEFPEKLVDTLLADVHGGHDICKMLALAICNFMIEVSSKWIPFLSSRGFLKYILESLVTSDKTLIDVLINQNRNLRPLFLFDAEMAFLTRIALSKEGAQLLLEHNAIYSLSLLSVFNHHPDVPFFNPDYNLSPSNSKFQQIIMPTLHFLKTILDTLGSKNRSATSQIMGFLLDHFESIIIVLRYGNPLLPLDILKELSALTSIISATHSQHEVEVTKEFIRLQNMIVALVHRFLINEGLIKQIKSVHREENFTDVMHCILDIQCNVLLFLKNMTAASGTNKRITNVILEPTMTQATDQFSDVDNLYSNNRANLGVITRQLTEAVAHYHRESPNLAMLSNKISSVQDMNAATLHEFLPNNTNISITIDETRRMARTEIVKQCSMKKLELSKTRYIIDVCLYLVWAHLDYFMLRGIPEYLISSNKPSDSIYYAKLNESNAPLSEIVWDCNLDSLHRVREDLMTVFNVTFGQSLVKTGESSTNEQYIEALLRRIRKLVNFAPIGSVANEA